MRQTYYTVATRRIRRVTKPVCVCVCVFNAMVSSPLVNRFVNVVVSHVMRRFEATDLSTLTFCVPFLCQRCNPITWATYHNPVALNK